MDLRPGSVAVPAGRILASHMACTRVDAHVC